jgi:hypothetical protein
MSSSSREAEVLERQRQVANRLRTSSSSSSSSSSSTSSGKAIEGVSGVKRRRTTDDDGPLGGRAGSGFTASSSSATHHRPRVASSSSSSSSSTSTSRPSVSHPAVGGGEGPPPRPTTALVHKAAASSRWNDAVGEARAAGSTAMPPPPPSQGSLSSILLSNAGTARFLKPDAPKLLRHYDKIEPNDYWKNMTSWDFLGDLNDRMTTNTTTTITRRNCEGKGGDDADDDGDRTKRRRRTTPPSSSTTSSPLPDSFGSYREYCALWAPLCLEEARAQLLSEVVGDIPHWKGAGRRDRGPVRVALEPMRKDVHSTSDFVGVRVRDVLTESSDYKDRAFIANDIVILMRDESHLWEAAGGTLLQEKKQPPRQGQSCRPDRHGLVGYIEYTHRSIEGLIVQVSRQLWSDVGTSEMVLLKLGCNITSLREFTALCRMDSIPLLEYILGSKMTSSKVAARPAKSMAESCIDAGYLDATTDMHTSDEKGAKRDVLSMMGGPSALGKGFADYASRKFNLSQLGAISASAQEYGEGGFTLIKGPPGKIDM